MKRKPRLPFLVCTESFDRFGIEKRTSAWLATPRMSRFGTVTWDPAGRKAFVPRMALPTWLGLMRSDSASERDLMFIGIMEACVEQLVEDE